MTAQLRLGYESREVSAQRCGYDIESGDPSGGHLRFIEVKGRQKDGKTIPVTRNEIVTALNKPDEILRRASAPNEDASTSYVPQRSVTPPGRGPAPA